MNVSSRNKTCSNTKVPRVQFGRKPFSQEKSRHYTPYTHHIVQMYVPHDTRTHNSIHVCCHTGIVSYTYRIIVVPALTQKLQSLQQKFVGSRSWNIAIYQRFFRAMRRFVPINSALKTLYHRVCPLLKQVQNHAHHPTFTFAHTYCSHVFTPTQTHSCPVTYTLMHSR